MLTREPSNWEIKQSGNSLIWWRWQIIRADILLIAFTTQLATISACYGKPSNKVSVFICYAPLKGVSLTFWSPSTRSPSSSLSLLRVFSMVIFTLSVGMMFARFQFYDQICCCCCIHDQVRVMRSTTYVLFYIRFVCFYDCMLVSRRVDWKEQAFSKIWLISFRRFYMNWHLKFE